ncbi:hypothetical protein QUA40_14560, partial [Microcoleus sp. Pol11C3]|uniref:hypothetical protein n=1 Tax=Microcoleus sp. Pol11C3 TaxID=3055390 RepID=UPI002FD43FD6
ALYSRSRAQNPGYLKCDRYIQQALNTGLMQAQYKVWLHKSCIGENKPTTNFRRLSAAINCWRVKIQG